MTPKELAAIEGRMNRVYTEEIRQDGLELSAEVRSLRAENRRLRAALRDIRTGTDDQWSMDRAREALKPRKARRAGRKA